jgi:iron-sulfur cluster repair protein YtfE (RIC family)
MTDLELETRPGLPEALRVLLRDYPRDGWAAQRNFEGLVRFWLDRHQMFRQIMAQLRRETELVLDRRTEERVFAGRLARLGGAFVAELHGHHQIEDAHYFPVLAQAEPQIEAGFSLLDRDHHALDARLQGFVDAANPVLAALDRPEGLRAEANRFAEELARLERLLDRHLVDEEELVVPVILRYGAASLG